MTLLEKEPANRFPNAAALVARALGRHERDSGAHRGAAPRSAPSQQDWHRARSRPRRPRRCPSTRDAASRTIAATSEEMARWMAPEVRKFRGSFGTFAFVNAVIVIASIFGHADFYVITVLWWMIMAFKYSKLWNAGYDWRDVFRQPRDRRLVDVAGETIEEARGLFDQGAPRAAASAARGARRPCRPCRRQHGAAARRRIRRAVAPTWDRIAARCSARSRIATRFCAW